MEPQCAPMGHQWAALGFQNGSRLMVPCEISPAHGIHFFLILLEVLGEFRIVLRSFKEDLRSFIKTFGRFWKVLLSWRGFSGPL